MNAFTLIPQPLMQTAYAFGGEYAWDAEHALSVISCFRHDQVPILGLDVWIPR